MPTPLPTRLPLTVRVFNQLARPFARTLLPLDARSLLATASRRAKLDDFGDDGFREPLSRLLASLDGEAGLTPLGRVIARTELTRWLQNRLEMADWRRRHPEIANERIERPLFVIGMGRTGTTILHDLLAQDPESRVPHTWELARPCPPPELAHADDDPRIAEVDQELNGTDRLIPEFKKMHPMGARLPQECVSITSHEFSSMIHQTEYRIPSYYSWLHDKQDLAPVYRAHRRFLQHLQWRWPAKRWVLKSPGHLWAIHTLLGEYPDARMVQTHRDPLKVVASLSSLIEMLRSMTSWQFDRGEIAREWMEQIAVALDRSVDVRQSGVIDPAHIVDIQFGELMREPFTAIRRLYERFEMPYSDDVEARMRRYLAENSVDKHGGHRYRWSDTGIDTGEARARFRRYVEYFGVEEERVD
jgi:hypothetical protein